MCSTYLHIDTQASMRTLYKYLLPTYLDFARSLQQQLSSFLGTQANLIHATYLTTFENVLKKLQRKELLY
jgi:hypothetical protein